MLKKYTRDKAKASRQLSLTLVMLVLMGLIAQTALSITPARAAGGFANDAFAAEWNRVDGPVERGEVNRPYLYGPPAAIVNEEYKQSQDGLRQVQYFKYGRMELTRPDQPNSPAYLGDGRLVLEMITGLVQVGDNNYVQFDGAEQPIAGGDRFDANPGAPSYRAFQSLLGSDLSAIGEPVNLVLPSPEGENFFLGFPSASVDSALGQLATQATYISQSGHNIPDVFWKFLNQTEANGEKLFNWQSLYGLPLTDAYWVKVRENGSARDILVQPFERRVLRYDSNDTSYKVRDENVGEDYYNWRYKLPELPIYVGGIEASTGKGSVTPAVADAGATFVFRGQGFTPGESLNSWIEECTTDTEGCGSFPQTVRLNDKGEFALRLGTIPLFTPSLKLRLVVIGVSSGNKVVLNARIIGNVRYTPGVELVQPSDVPRGINAELDKTVLKVGEDANLTASGFKPGERLRAWVQSPLGRSSSWEGLIFSFSAAGDYPLRLFADKSGRLEVPMPTPGSATPGIYNFTVYGTESGKSAQVFFRVRAGNAYLFDPLWGAFSFELRDGAPPVKPTQPQYDYKTLSRNPQLKSLWQLQLEPLDE